MKQSDLGKSLDPTVVGRHVLVLLERLKYWWKAGLRCRKYYTGGRLDGIQCRWKMLKFYTDGVEWKA